MIKKSKVGLIFAGIVLSLWLLLLPTFALTGNSDFLFIFFIFGLFISPLWWGFLKAIIGENRIDKLINKSLMIMVVILALVVFLLGVFTLIFQIYEYLRIGEWIKFSIIDGLLLLNSDWAMKPYDWLGLWKILNKIPASLILIVLSFLILAPLNNENLFNKSNQTGR